MHTLSWNTIYNNNFNPVGTYNLSALIVNMTNNIVCMKCSFHSIITGWANIEGAGCTVILTSLTTVPVNETLNLNFNDNDVGLGCITIPAAALNPSALFDIYVYAKGGTDIITAIHGISISVHTVNRSPMPYVSFNMMPSLSIKSDISPTVALTANLNTATASEFNIYSGSHMALK